MMPKMSFSVQRRVSTMTTRLFNSAGVSSRGEGRTPHELTIGGDDDVSEFSLRVNSIPPEISVQLASPNRESVVSGIADQIGGGGGIGGIGNGATAMDKKERVRRQLLLGGGGGRSGLAQNLMHTSSSSPVASSSRLALPMVPVGASALSDATTVLGVPPRGRSNGELPTIAAAGFKRRISKATETSPSKHPPGAGAAGGGGGAGSILSAINLSSNPGGGGGVTPRTDGESSAAKSSPSPLEKVNLAGVCKSLAKFLGGVGITLLMTALWVASTQFIKSTYTGLLWPPPGPMTSAGGTVFSWEWLRSLPFNVTASRSANWTTEPAGPYDTDNLTAAATPPSPGESVYSVYSAPFFTTWLCNVATVLYLPLYVAGKVVAGGPKKSGLGAALRNAVQNFREKGFTPWTFFLRCFLFALLWALTTYLYALSLKILGATEVTALLATSVSFVYLMAWVVLHEEFVGTRIVAVILCNTGIALLAYMDGVTGTPTLGGVVLAAAAAAGFAVHKVLFRRVMGDALTFCQVSIFFSANGLCCALFLWPMVLALAFSEAETVRFDALPWLSLVGAIVFSLAVNLLTNFGVAVTNETFLTLGLIVAVPACAFADLFLYTDVTFRGMKLAGMVCICLGFVVVMLPSNLGDIFFRILSLGKRPNRDEKEPKKSERSAHDLRTGYIGSRLRSPSGRVK